MTNTHSSLTTHTYPEIATVKALINILPEVRDVLWRTFNPQTKERERKSTTSNVYT